MYKVKKKKIKDFNLFLPDEITTIHKYTSNSSNPSLSNFKNKFFLSSPSKANVPINKIITIFPKKEKAITKSNDTLKLETSKGNNYISHSTSLSNPILSTSKTLSLEHFNTNFSTKTNVDYNKIIKQKDILIKKLLEENRILKAQVAKRNILENIYSSSHNLPLFGESKQKLSKKKKKESERHSNQFFKNSNDLKIQEKLLSQRIAKFYTPKVNEIMKNINSNRMPKSNNLICKTRKVFKIHSKGNKQNKKSNELSTISLNSNIEDIGSLNSSNQLNNKNNTNNRNNTNYKEQNSLWSIKKRVNDLFNNLIEIIGNNNNQYQHY